ncbi:MAG: hypothetical protein KR126chlam3_00670 [Chlamydiae bacterium]|nr:hypothetical protein [Chlamydiota bacterium]
MLTPPFTPYSSPSQTRSRDYFDPELEADLLDLALENTDEEKPQKVARRLFDDEQTFPSAPPPSTPPTPLSPASSSSSFVPHSPPAQREFSPSSYSSPSRRQFRAAIPPTPGFALRKKPKGTIFPGNTLQTINDPSPIDMKAPFSLDVVYQDQYGNKHNLFKQPEGSKSCWAYSFAMLLSNLVRSGKSLQLDNPFWMWFQNAYLLNGVSEIDAKG